MGSDSTRITATGSATKFGELLARLTNIPGRDVSDDVYRVNCSAMMRKSFNSQLKLYAKGDAAGRRQCRDWFDQLERVAGEPVLKAFVQMGTSYMDLVDSLEWRDVRISRKMVRSDAAFDAIMQGAALATGVTLAKEPSYPKLRREALRMYQNARDRDEVRATMFIPAPYEGTNLYPEAGEKLAVNPIAPVVLSPKVSKELEQLYTLRFSATRPEEIKSRAEKYSESRIEGLLETCHAQGVYNEFKTVVDVTALPPLRQLSVLRVMEDYDEPHSHSMAVRNVARAQPILMSYATMNRMRAEGLSTQVARRMHRHAGGEKQDAAAGSEAMFTLMQPHNPIMTDVEKAERAYGLKPGEGGDYHLSRREDMRRALLHEMGHALYNDKLTREGRFSSPGANNANESEMVSDVFASLILRDTSLRTELRAYEALQHDTDKEHYTNPALVRITKKDISDAEYMNMPQVFALACKIAKRGRDAYKPSEMNDLRKMFNSAFKRQLQKEEGRKVHLVEITPEKKHMADSKVWLAAIEECQKCAWLSDMQQEVLKEAKDDVNFISQQRSRESKVDYISDVLHTGSFAGSVPALVELLHHQHIYMQRQLEQSFKDCMNALEARNADGVAQARVGMSAMVDEMQDLRHLSDSLRVGIKTQEAVMAKVGEGESVRAKK